MRLLSMLLCCVLGGAILFLSGSPSAFADSGGTAAPTPASVDAPLPVEALPGTPEESRTYEQREEASPEVQEFAGGAVYVGVGVVVLVLLVVLVVLLMR